MAQQRPASSQASRAAIAVAAPDSTWSEEGRLLLQDRLRLWTLSVCVLSTALFVFNVGLWSLNSRDVLRVVSELPQVLHFTAVAIFAAAWLRTRGGAISSRLLRLIDLVALVAGSALYILMAALIARAQAMPAAAATALYAGLLGWLNLVTSRAALVPSTPRRTFYASTFAALPLLPGVAASRGSVGNASPDLIANIAFWTVLAIVIATVSSRVLFGLRREAARIRRLGQYTLEEQIGAGGMGIVYRARHALLRRPTAIKLLAPHRSSEADVARFEREVQTTAQLRHPNTVAIYDYGRTPDGVFYYAMEYLDGINVQDLVASYGPQPPGRVIRILDQICGALAEAHDQGVIHRDIKPPNIILTERGGEFDVVKVVDFGLVQSINAEAAGVTFATRAEILGTPHYLSPEAALASSHVDARSDLYSLGAVGYFLITGHLVFEAATVFEAMLHHVQTTPLPPSQRTEQPVPPDLEALILCCLQKNPADRPLDAAALRRDLRRLSAALDWTDQHARGWWQAFRGARQHHAPSLAAPDAPTVLVDLESRAAVYGPQN